jgi:hypothetical protein
MISMEPFGATWRVPSAERFPIARRDARRRGVKILMLVWFDLILV